MIVIILSFLIISAYWPVHEYNFLSYDDSLYVTDNYIMKKNMASEGIRSAFTHFRTGHWHPLTMISHMLDWKLFGDKAGGHHWTNVIIHILNTILLFLLLNKLTGAIWRCAFVAALFAIHPLNVESVAWISERKNVLSTFFLFATVNCYVWYINKKTWKRYLPVCLCFALGLMSKPMLVTLPFVLLLLDYWPLNRLQINDNQNIKKFITINGKIILNLFAEKAPLFILSIISSYLTVYASKYVSDIVRIDSFPIQDRLMNAVFSYFLYIKKMFLPTDLAILYPISNIPLWQFSFALVFLVIITLFVCRNFKRYPYLFVGWFWYLGTLVPVIGLIQVGSQAMADRYAYVPLIGIFIMLTWGFADIVYRRISGKVIFLIGLIFLCYLILWTAFQIQYWRDTSSLFQQALRVTEKNLLAHLVLGDELLNKNKIDEAIYHYNKSLTLDPGSVSGMVRLGRALNVKGEQDKAVHNLRKAIELDPKYADAHYNLGFVLLQKGDMDGAVVEYTKAISLLGEESDSIKSSLYNNLGIALTRKGEVTEAINAYRKALFINPNHAGAHNNLAMLLMNQGNIKEAVKHFRDAIMLENNFANAHYHLAQILLKEGKEGEANYHYRKAIKINPSFKIIKVK